MALVECSHPIDKLTVGVSTRKEIVFVECTVCHDMWKTISVDKLISHVEICGDGYVQVRNDGRHATTTRPYELTGWEKTHNAVA